MPQAAVGVRVLRLAGLALLVLAGLSAVALLPLVGRRGRAAMTRLWSRSVLAASGVRLVVRGRSLHYGQAGVLVVANHVSWLDIPALLAVAPMRVVAKAEVRRWPLVGLLAASAGALFIDRYRLRRLPAAVAALAYRLCRGERVLVFPEGTTWCGVCQGPVYRATMQAAIDGGAAVIPVTVRYQLAGGAPTTAAAFVGADPLVRSIRRVVATRGLVVEVVITPALPVGGGADRRVLAAAVRTRIHARASDPSRSPYRCLVSPLE